MEYIPFTPEQVEQANQVDLEEFLLQHGEKLLRSGPEKRLASNHSVTIRGNEWFDHADRKGGKAVTFVERYLDVPFQEAMQILLGEQGVVYAPAQPKREEPPKPFVLPPAHTDNRRVRAYLERTRKISGEVLRTFEKEGLIYEDSQYHNAVFVGFDEAGVARHAHKRSTNTQGRQFKINVEGCNARYSFHWTGSSDKIYVFEAPIDMLSFISMKPDWQQHSYVGLCGLSEHALIQQLEEHPQLSDIVLCMDNDEAGIAARNRIKHILQERGYTKVSSLLPSSKDWNEDIQRGIVMTEKVREYLTLSRETTVAITQDQERWKAFLCTAGQMYKYSFNDQVLIFAQRPEATACASYDVWNKTMRRYVKRGAKGIALLDTQDKHLKMHYVFDVSDTSDGNRAREVHVWQMKEEQTPSVQKVLENTFGVPATIGGIQEQLTGIASVLWMNRWTQHKDDILDNIDDSFKKEYDEFTIQEMFRNAVVPSVVGAVCSRCGVQMPGMTVEDFENISKFQTPKMVNILGDIVTGFSNETLRVVERTVKQLEKDERSKQHGYSVQTSGRGSDPRPGADGHRYDTHSAVGADAQRVFAGAQAVHVQRHGDGADPVSPPSGDRPGSSGADGHSDAAAGQGGGSHGGAEEEGPDEVGGPDEHLQGPSGGDYPGGTDLQLSLFPTEAEQIQRIEEAERVADTFSAFSFAQADIDHVLRLGGNTYRQRECIVVAFEEQKSTAEIADTLRNLYHGGNGIGSVTAWYAEDGIHLSHGKTARYDKSAQVISWESAAERIGQLLQDGQFASSVELSEAEGYERTRLAEKLWHLHHDFSEEAKEAEYLPSLADNPGRGFPEESAWLTEQLKSPEFRQIIAEEYAAFWKAYRQDRKLMRFHYHKPREIWEGLKDLSLPRTKFSSQKTEVPSVKQFISEDEIDVAMARGSGFEGGKGRIFTFFQEKHTDKERVDFLRHEYGIGGYTHALSGAMRSEESHDGKGLHYKKDACPEVHFSWEKVAKRITSLIQKGRYLTEHEQAEYDKIQAEKAMAEEDAMQAQQPEPEIWGYNGVKERHPDDMVLYQMGDFYELYGEDAKKAAHELGLSLISRTIPGGGHVAMCGFPAKRLEQVVEQLRDKHDVTISAVPEGGKERQEYTIISIDHEAEQHINAQEAEFGADGTRVFRDNETGAGPTIGEYGYPITFQNWEQAYEWIDGAQLLDTPGLREQVQEILHTDINLTGGESQLEEALPIPFVEGYAALKAQYYDAVVGVEVGRYVVFLGDDAHIASKAMGTKVLSVDIPGMGVTDMTGNHLGWPAVLKRLMEQNLNIVLAQQDPEGGPEAPYEIIKERYAGEYDLRTDEEYAQEELVPGETIIEMDGRTFQVSKLELDIGRVELRDITFAQAVGFPIFRIEPISVVRDYLEQEPVQVSEKTLEEILDEHPISVEINGQWHTFPNAAAAEEYENNLRGNAQNYHITDENLGTGGPKEKFWRNIKAIATLKQIEQENRNATLEEQHLLSQYVGWGGLADAFDPEKSAWAAEYAQLKELLTPEEYASARGSTLNAHYTSPTVIRAIYEAVCRMGFETGNILEPSCGVGNFFGMLPESMAGSKLYGVELDSISGRIAQKLYPQADITVAGFETTDRRDFYDLAIGNVPFGQYQVNDKAYNKLKFNIHNYFFAKALDQVRPGGVVAFVTSRYTMDAKDSTVRRYLAQRAELLGAIRLPNNAFKANAGAEVVSDIIFLQRRERPLEITPEWTQVGQNQEGHTINQYFVDHPNMVLGREELQSSAHGMAYTVSPLEDTDLAQQLQEAVRHIGGSYEPVELDMELNMENKQLEDQSKQSSRTGHKSVKERHGTAR